MKSLYQFLFILILTVLTAYSPERETSLQGIWVRKSDNLKIKIVPEGADQLTSFIVEEGNEKFPCDVSSLAIYKNIVPVKSRVWKCDFLVVTLGRCSTDYEQGEIWLTKAGDIEVICPGFSKKTYKKLRPRYSNGSK